MPGLPCTAAVPWRRHPVGLAGPNTHCILSTCASAAHGVALAKLQPRSCAVAPGIVPACATLPAPPGASHQGWDFGGKCGGRLPLLASLLQHAACLPCCPKLSVTCCSPVPAQPTLSPGKLLTHLFPRGLCGTAHLPVLTEGWHPTWCCAYLCVWDVIY